MNKLDGIYGGRVYLSDVVAFVVFPDGTISNMGIRKSELVKVISGKETLIQGYEVYHTGRNSIRVLELSSGKFVALDLDELEQALR